MGSRRARAVRGMLASATAIFVAALFHVAGGGSAPGAVPLALSMAFATLASIALTARRLSLWRLAVSVGLSQFLFHMLFSLSAGSATFSTADGGSAGGMAHVHAGSHLTMSLGAMPAAHSAATPSMWLTHATAVLVTVIALRFGERAFWGLFETARLRVSRLVARVRVVPVRVAPALRAVVDIEVPLPRELGLPFARLRHRGPPLVLGAS